MREVTVSPAFGEDWWVFLAEPARVSTLEVIFSSPVRIRKVRVDGRLFAIDDRDADIIEMANRQGVQVVSGTCLRFRTLDVRSDVKIWISKVADPGVTAKFRWSEVGR